MNLLRTNFENIQKPLTVLVVGSFDSLENRIKVRFITQVLIHPLGSHLINFVLTFDRKQLEVIEEDIASLCTRRRTSHYLMVETHCSCSTR